MNEVVESKIGLLHRDISRWESVIEYMEPIIDLYTDDSISEIMINRYDHILVQTDKGQKLTDAKFASEDLLRRFITQVAGALKQKFNDEYPILDARFPDDSRLCCVSESVSPKGANVTIRIARSGGGIITPERMINTGYMSQEMWDYLVDSYAKGKNIIFSGNTGSGKTSMMRNLINTLSDQERILIVEDTNEINIDHINVLNMEAAEKLSSTTTMEQLIKNTLRQFGSKLVVGEIRDAQASNALIQAINTGVTGCMGSLHANNSAAALSRLQYLLTTLGYVSYDLAGHLVMTSIDIFVHCQRSPEFGRKITEIKEVNKMKNGLDSVYYLDQNNVHING